MNTTFATILEIVGTLAFAISGIRLAAAKQFDWFGAYAVGLVTAIGGHSSYFRHYFQTILGKTRKYVFHIRYDRVSSICRRGSRKNTHVRISVLGSYRHGNHYGIGRQYHSRYPHQRRASAIS